MRFLLVILFFITNLFSKDYIIDQKGKTFIPHKVILNVGDTIVFKNSDPFSHNAYTDNEANEFDIGMQAPGTMVRVPIKSSGEFIIECAIHPNMLLEVIVK
jgi:plastocyanin